MTAKNGLLLNVGLSKTGSTTLQNCLFASHSQIHYLGKYQNRPIPRQCLSEDVYECLNPLLWDISDQTDIDALKSILHEKIMPDVKQGQCLVGSWEGLGQAPGDKFAKRIRLIQSVFGSCRIMMTIRNPLTQIPSLYLQNIKGHFVSRSREWMGKRPYMDIDEWLTKRIAHRGSLDNVLPYSNRIKKAMKLCGKENVGVFLFEELKDNPKGYYSTVCNFIGIDAEEGLEVTQENHLHPRIMQSQLDYLQRLNRSSWQRLKLKLKGDKARKRQFKAAANDGHPARVVLSPHWEKNISDNVRDGHQWLAETFSLPLKKYNYSL